MRSELRKCVRCGRYTLRDTCPSCSSDTHCPVPPKFSPEDRMGEYRRKSILREYGENGRLGHL